MVVTLKVDDFDKIIDKKSGQPKSVKRFTWNNSNNVQVQVITLGGIITSIKVPSNSGKIDDVVLGFDTAAEYLAPKNRYYGALIGRVANRTAKGKMTVEGVTYTLPINNGPNHLHGGLLGFDKVIWEYYVKDTKVFLSYHSADMEEGYPGDLLTTVSYELTDDNQILIEYEAYVTKPCPVNLTNHSYFNLGGHQSGSTGLYGHLVTINADKTTEVNNLIPTGKLLPVRGTPFDLRVAQSLGDAIKHSPDNGFDHNFCVTKPATRQQPLNTNSLYAFVAKMEHPPSGRTMEVYSNQTGVQFYTSNFLPDDDSCKGKNGVCYNKHGAFCLETQIYPDAVNHDNFPKVILYPGEKYHHLVAFKFIVE